MKFWKQFQFANQTVNLAVQFKTAMVGFLKKKTCDRKQPKAILSYVKCDIHADI